MEFVCEADIPAAECCVDDPMCCDSSRVGYEDKSIEVLTALRQRDPGRYAFATYVLSDSPDIDGEAERWATGIVLEPSGFTELYLLTTRKGEATRSVAAVVTLKPTEYFDACIASALASDSCAVAACLREPFEPASCTAELVCLPEFAVHGSPCDSQ